MRILELTLENFSPILAGTGKEKIHIDLRNSNTLINVFIGKIGSGKTYILSHLQPFATVGTMDVRNADDPIIVGKDGYKQIIYDINGVEYNIEHFYTSTSSGSHSKKSYIKKNDVELNPNGNISSFNDIILLEFGIDQSFMRLMRLGPNVVNFINMKATERKSYIASLLKETEGYLLLYKHWSSDLRVINTKVNVLMNKLSTFGTETIEELDEQMEDLEDKRKDRQSKLDSLKQRKMEAKASTTTYLNGLSYSEFQSKKKDDIEKKNQMFLDIDSLKDKLKEFESQPELTEVSKDIGKYDTQISTISTTLYELDSEFNECNDELNSLLDKRAMSGDISHMETLQESYDDLVKKADQYQKQLKGFKCNYSSAYLSSLLEEINLMNVLINEITQYDKDMVERVYHADSSIISYAHEKVEVLGYRKLKIQKLINNLKFSENYEPPERMYRPPFCPTPNCPYFTSHPITIKKQTSGKDEVNEQLLIYQNEIQELDVEIYKYNDYPLLYSKISSLKEYWKKVKPVLESIKALNTEDLKKVLLLMNYQVWYNYDKIIDTIDLIEKRDKYIELTEKIKEIKSELNALDLAKESSVEERISECEKKKSSLLSKIEENEKKRKDYEDKLKSLNELYVELSRKGEYELELRELQSLYTDISKSIDKMSEAELQINDNLAIIQSLDVEIVEYEDKLKTVLDKIDTLRTKINDISYTRNELEGLLKEQKWMTHMVDAVGSKKGIPMIMVKLFFESCRNTINDMLYMVTEDEFYLEEFEIGENEFYIPYTVNGSRADDISKASQGQSSITSTALSFAIVKELGAVEYNIPLLDEMDAPLHKNDKQKFIPMLLQYLKDIGSEQCFAITHDENTFDNYPVQVIMTTDENVNQIRYANAIHI